MANRFEPQGKTFLVTGGASGLGAQNVETFLKDGAKGVAILDVHVDNGKTLAERLNKNYPNRVIFVKCDVSNAQEADRAFNEVLNQFKQLHVIINNAGIMVDNPAVCRKACDVNWVDSAHVSNNLENVLTGFYPFQQGLVDFTLKGIKHTRKDSGGAGGAIINISSIVALYSLRFLPIYCGSKAAVLHFTKSISGGNFHEKTGIRLLTICFGPTETALMERLEERVWDESSVEEFLDAAAEPQRVESAVASVHKIFREAPNGSIWLSIANKPVNDLTPLVDAAFTEFERAMFS